ncbi:MAG TPA: hypothetical protein VHT27_01570 [Solirubrobacteraceae bacterium]|nr:hypothetical protein [Solirubrobacteraceae bacterium]
MLASTLGAASLLLGAPALAQAEESNPNNYSCLGSLKAGTPEAGSEEQQVSYSFYCDGPVTGYQLQSQVPVTGISSPPTVTNTAGATISDTFSCSGEIPGWAVNCVGAAKAGYETISGQFAIGSKLCKEPRVDALLTVTYAYLEKGAVVQAISGPFDLGRPTSCKADSLSGGTRLNPRTPVKKKHKHSKHKSAKKSRRK